MKNSWTGRKTLNNQSINRPHKCLRATFVLLSRSSLRIYVTLESQIKGKTTVNIGKTMEKHPSSVTGCCHALFKLTNLFCLVLLGVFNISSILEFVYTEFNYLFELILLAKFFCFFILFFSLLFSFVVFCFGDVFLCLYWFHCGRLHFVAHRLSYIWRWVNLLGRAECWAPVKHV